MQQSQMNQLYSSYTILYSMYEVHLFVLPVQYVIIQHTMVKRTVPFFSLKYQWKTELINKTKHQHYHINEKSKKLLKKEIKQNYHCHATKPIFMFGFTFLLVAKKSIRLDCWICSKRSYKKCGGHPIPLSLIHSFTSYESLTYSTCMGFHSQWIFWYVSVFFCCISAKLVCTFIHILELPIKQINYWLDHKHCVICMQNELIFLTQETYKTIIFLTIVVPLNFTKHFTWSKNW